MPPFQPLADATRITPGARFEVGGAGARIHARQTDGGDVA